MFSTVRISKKDIQSTNVQIINVFTKRSNHFYKKFHFYSEFIKITQKIINYFGIKYIRKNLKNNEK
jgi:hypothetical protein